MGFSDHMKVILGVDTKGFNTGLTKAEKRASKFGNMMKTKVLPFLGAAALARSAKEVVNFGAAIGDMSDRLGVGSEFLQKFQFAASQNGIASNEAGIALQRFTRRVADAKENGGKLKETLEKLNISFDDSSGRAKTTEELFQEFGAALSDMKDPAEKLRIAFTFLDTEGAKLTQLFRDGAPTIAEYGAEAEKLGIIVKDDQVKALQAASGAMEEMGRTFKSFLAAAAKPLTGVIQTLNEGLKGAIKIVKNYGTEITVAATAVVTYYTALKTLKGALAVTAAIKAMGVAAGVTSKTMKLLAIATNAVFTGNFVKAAKAATLAIKGMAVAVAANPLGLLIAGAAALATGLFLLSEKSEAASDKLKELEKRTLARLEKEMQNFKQVSNDTKLEIIRLQQELVGLQNMDEIKIPIGEQLELVNKEVDALNTKLKNLRENEKAFLETNLALQEHKLELQEQENAGDVEIAQTKRNIEALNARIEGIKKRELEIQIKQEKALQKQKTLQQQMKDAEDARQMGITDLLEGKNKETIELQRQVELLEAAKTGNQELIDRVKERHKFQDEVARLVKDENMSLQEAADLVRQRMQVDKELEAAEKAIADAIEQQKGAKQGVNEEAKRAIEQAQQEKAIHEQNKKIFNDQLRVMKLRAQGREEDAEILEKQLENEKEIKDIMEQQGVNQVDAIDLLKQKLKLEKEITQELLDQKIAAIRDKALEEGEDLNNLGASDRAKKLREMDKEERQRARDAARAKRLQDKIDRGDFEPDEDPEKIKKMLDKLKDKLLTDEQKKEIEKIKKQKKEAEERAKKIQADIDKKKKEAEKALADAAAKEKKKLDKVLEAGEEAIKNAGKDIAGEIKRIKAPVIDTKGIEAAIDGLAVKINKKINGKLPEKDYPDGSENGGVNTPQDFKDMFDNLATEDTLAAVHTTLKGKFVNQ
jgi:hypothetical protein